MISDIQIFTKIAHQLQTFKTPNFVLFTIIQQGFQICSYQDGIQITYNHIEFSYFSNLNNIIFVIKCVEGTKYERFSLQS